MTSENDELNERLQREFSRRERRSNALSVPSAADDTDTSRKRSDASRSGRGGAEKTRTELVPVSPEQASNADVVEEQLGMINRMRRRNAESAHQLEKARLAYRTEMQLIQHQAEAATRESKAFWDAKSVEVAESIKTYVQATIRALEIDRLDSRNADLQRAYEAATAAMEKARSSKMPEVMKDRLIQNILDNFEATLDRIQNDTIVSRYELD